MEIVVGVLSSFAASVVFLALSRLVTPKISISPMISAYPSDNADADDTYRIKIINKRFRSVSDLTVQVYVQHARIVHGGSVKVKRPIATVTTSSTMPRREIRGGDHDNCRRIRINAPKLEDVILNQASPQVIVEIYARDSWTGVGKLFRKTYALGLDSFKRGSFEFGNSLTIREYNGTAPFKLKDAYAARSTVGASPTA